MAETSLLARLRADYPTLRFQKAYDYYWAPEKNTIFYAGASSNQEKCLLLHELAHATLSHAHYQRDIELLAMERDAWHQTTTTLGPSYGVSIPTDVVEDALDTYRDWLHKRSLCPGCNSTGLQTGSAHYTCLGCNASWTVNEARRCGLKRYST